MIPLEADSCSKMSKVRPTGITILVFLEALASLLLLIGGLALVVLGRFAGDAIPVPIPRPLVGSFFALVGVVLLVFGLAGFCVCWGLWTGKSWAWSIALVLAVIFAIMGVASLPSGFFWLAINGLIAYYLWQPHVKTFFSKEVQAPAQPVQLQPRAVVYCSSCGTANSTESKFCSKCGSELRTF